MTRSGHDEKWTKGLSKIRKGFFGRIVDVFRKSDKEGDSLWEKLEAVLIEADLGVETTLEILHELQEGVSPKDPDAQEKTLSLLKKKIFAILREDRLEENNLPLPRIVLVVGVNGTGKTTTVGKMALQFRKNGKRVLLAGADTFRAAAGDQLDVWGKRSGADVVRQCMGADPAAVVFDAINAAVSRKADVLIIDTAGRLHTKVNLMEELKKIQRVAAKKVENAPHETLLVIDATTGQNGLHQAKLFTEAVPVTGIVLTKLDGTARGGIVVSIKKDLGIPVKWIGIGESQDDLIPFDPENFVDALLGTGH